MKDINLVLRRFLDFIFVIINFLYIKLGILFHFLFTEYLIPTYEMILVMSFFMISNLFTGIHKTIKFEGLKEVSFKRIIDSLIKLVLYVFGLIVIYVLQHHIGKDLVNFVYVYASFVSIREVKSIIENIEKITNTKIWYLIKHHITDLINKNLKIKNNEQR